MWFVVAAALAAPADGERLVFEASWMGVTAGVAEAKLSRSGDDWTATVTTRSAGWLAPIYPVDDRVVSTWRDGGGTIRYDTRFREGAFEQDQQMRFSPEAIVVTRKQKFEEGWREWEDRYDPVAGILDPVSAIYRLREAWTERIGFDAFSGRRVVPVAAEDLGADAKVKAADGTGTRRVAVTATSGADFRPWMTVWLTDDADRVPVRSVVTTRGGPVTLMLVERELPK